MFLKLVEEGVSDVKILPSVTQELNALESTPTVLSHQVAGQSHSTSRLPVAAVHEYICSFLQASLYEIEEVFGELRILIEQRTLIFISPW